MRSASRLHGLTLIAAMAFLGAAAVARAETPGSRVPGTPGAPGAPPPAEGAGPRTLHVAGEGRAYAAPDVASITLGVTALDPSLASATREASERARRVLDALAHAGVAPADVQTSRYEVQIERRPEKPEQPPRIAGYRVVNQLRVKVRELAKLGAILDRAVAAGANEVEALAFLKEDTSAEQGRALAAAVRSARAKAEEIARAAGVRLGEVLQLSEGGRAPGPIPLYRSAALAASAVPLAEGQLEIGAQVELVFAVH